MTRQILAFLMLLPAIGWAQGEFDGVESRFSADKLEWRTDDELAVLETEAWLGNDRNRLVVVASADVDDEGTEQWQADVLYARSIADGATLLLGGTRERSVGAERDWLMLSLRATAPLQIELEANLRSRGDLRSGEVVLVREVALSQRLSLLPELGFVAYSAANSTFGHGQGLAEMQLHLPLNLALHQQLTAYVALVWNRAFGVTADMVEADGDSRQNVQLALGVSFWW